MIGSHKADVKGTYNPTSTRRSLVKPQATNRSRLVLIVTVLLLTWTGLEAQNPLVLKAKLESLTMVSKEVKTVFDRQ